MDQNNKLSHNHYKAFHKYFSAACPVLALVIAVSVCLALLSDFDGTIGHFAYGSVYFGISVTAAVISVLITSAAAFIAGKSASFDKDPAENPATLIGALLCTVFSFMCMVSYAVDYALGMLSKFDIIFAVLIPFVGISMALTVSEKTRFVPVRRICAILGAAAVNMSLFADYFDFTLPLNSPIRHIMTVVKAAVLLYLLSEARFSFGMSSKRLNLAASVFAAGMTAALALGFTAGMFAADLIDIFPLPSASELALFAAVGVHAAGRMFAMLPAIGKYVPPVDEKKNKNAKTDTETAK